MFMFMLSYSLRHPTQNKGMLGDLLNSEHATASKATTWMLILLLWLKATSKNNCKKARKSEVKFLTKRSEESIF